MGKYEWRRNLARNLVRIRKSQGISQRDMAKMLGMGISSLRALEREKLPPRLRIDFLFRIKEHFEIEPGKMFEQELE